LVVVATQDAVLVSRQKDWARCTGWKIRAKFCWSLSRFRPELISARTTSSAVRTITSASDLNGSMPASLQLAARSLDKKDHQHCRDLVLWSLEGCPRTRTRSTLSASEGLRAARCQRSCVRQRTLARPRHRNASSVNTVCRTWRQR